MTSLLFGAAIQDGHITSLDDDVIAIQSYWPAAFNHELNEHNDTVVDALIAVARGR